MTSIIQREKECYFCFTQEGLHTHHCLHGSASRQKADEDGLTVKLCWRCHYALHDRGTGDTALKKLAQIKWMDHYKRSEQDFIERYGRSYLHIGEPYEK